MTPKTKAKTYTVHAKRWTHGWELHIDGVGVTQSHNLADAERMARDYIALDLEIPEDSFRVEIIPEVGDGLDDAARAAREDILNAAQLQQKAAERSREVARRLSEKGLSGRDIAAILGVSPQRVSQLLKTSQIRAAKIEIQEVIRSVRSPVRRK